MCASAKVYDILINLKQRDNHSVIKIFKIKIIKISRVSHYATGYNIVLSYEWVED